MDRAEAIWVRPVSTELLTGMLAGNMTGHLGIQFTSFGSDFLEATMPVDHRTVQPFGLLHGGASVALAETLASVAGYLCSEEGSNVVGIEVNANHVRSADSGTVVGKATPVHLGSSTQVWRVQISREDGKLVCESRVTLMVIRDRA